ncbi:MAG: class I SAM-dependent methyltransferase, partial [Chloroflexota bacterium]
MLGLGGLGYRIRRRIARLGRGRGNGRIVAGDRLAAHRQAVIDAATRHDMISHPDELYYAEQYLYWIEQDLVGRFPDRALRILDLGCGQGRIALPLAQRYAPDVRVTGVDLTPAVVDAARRHARDRHLSNVVFQEADVLEFARSRPNACADVIVFLEVSFILPTLRDVSREIGRILRPGGLLFIAGRSQHYNLLQTVRARSWESARLVIDRREGYLFGGQTYFTWQTPEDLDRLLTDSGLRVLSHRGVGVCSGILGDPLAGLARPGKMSGQERRQLMQVELAVAER